MVKAQARFDRYAMPACPEELTAPVLHRVLEYEPLQPHIWGGKGVGSQGDGTAQFLARSEADQKKAWPTSLPESFWMRRTIEAHL